MSWKSNVTKNTQFKKCLDKVVILDIYLTNYIISEIDFSISDNCKIKILLVVNFYI